MDELSLGLLEVNFNTGDVTIPPGYDFTTFEQYSTIVLTFDTVTTDGFTYDLGAGIADGQEIACLAS